MAESVNAGELVILSHSFPAGNGEWFLAAELPYLAERFRRVVLVPFCAAPGEWRPVPAGVEVQAPLLAGETRANWRGGWGNPRVWPEFARDFWRGRVWLSPRRVRNWLRAWGMTGQALADGRWDALLAGCRWPVIYSYWGLWGAWLLPFVKTWPAARVARFHGLDLYSERNENRGYLPLRRAVFAALDRAAAVSASGANYLIGHYGLPAAQVERRPLGVEDAGEGRPSPDGVLRLATCARAVPVKRLELIVAALAQTRPPVEWTLIGDGPQLSELQALCGQLPAGIKANFLGERPNRQVRAFYREQPVDLFGLASESEGLPVSIMEALAAGIPVMATDVGGVGELVDAEVGRLLPAANPVAALAEGLNWFRDLPVDARARLRAAARQRWRERADAARNFPAFAAFLAGLASPAQT